MDKKQQMSDEDIEIFFGGNGNDWFKKFLLYLGYHPFDGIVENMADIRHFRVMCENSLLEQDFSFLVGKFLQKKGHCLKQKRHIGYELHCTFLVNIGYWLRDLWEESEDVYDSFRHSLTIFCQNYMGYWKKNPLLFYEIIDILEVAKYCNCNSSWKLISIFLRNVVDGPKERTPEKINDWIMNGFLRIDYYDMDGYLEERNKLMAVPAKTVL